VGIRDGRGTRFGPARKAAALTLNLRRIGRGPARHCLIIGMNFGMLGTALSG
jgi:hypothetical protein